VSPIATSGGAHGASFGTRPSFATVFEQSIARSDKVREAEWAEFAELDEDEQGLDGCAADTGRSEHATAMAPRAPQRRTSGSRSVPRPRRTSLSRLTGIGSDHKGSARRPVTSQASEGRVPSR
jgi:hypothetical protein